MPTLSEATNAERGQHRSASRPRFWTRAGVMTGKTLCALLSAAIVLGFGYGWKNFRDLNSGLQRFTLPSINTPAQPDGTVTGTAQPQNVGAVKGVAQNILIVGIDDRADMTPSETALLHVGQDSSLSTDVIMIVHVPADGSKATLISIPRDSYVTIPGFLKNKINAAYADGYTGTTGDTKAKQAAGADLLIRAVRELTGLSINHYVQIGFVGFYRIAQAINGIRVNLCHAVDDTGAHNAAEGQSGGSGFLMSAGTHDLTAVQSLEFVRQRHNLAGGDLDRAKRQRYFITAAFRKIASAGVLLNPSKLRNLVRAIDRSLYVDNGFRIIDFASQMTRLSADNIVGKTIPTAGNSSIAGVGDVISVDPATVRAFLSQLLSGTQPGAPKSAAQSSTSTSSSSSTSGSASPTAVKALDSGCIN